VGHYSEQVDDKRRLGQWFSTGRNEIEMWNRESRKGIVMRIAGLWSFEAQSGDWTDAGGAPCRNPTGQQGNGEEKYGDGRVSYGVAGCDAVKKIGKKPRTREGGSQAG
jgi:hypothetical protein